MWELSWENFQTQSNKLFKQYNKKTVEFVSRMSNAYPICIRYVQCQKWKQFMSYSKIRFGGCIFLRLFWRLQYQYCKSRQRYYQGWCYITQQLLSRGKSNHLKFLNDYKLNTVSFIKAPNQIAQKQPFVRRHSLYIRSTQIFYLVWNRNGREILISADHRPVFLSRRKRLYDKFIWSLSTRFSPQDICFSV